MRHFKIACRKLVQSSIDFLSFLAEVPEVVTGDRVRAYLLVGSSDLGAVTRQLCLVQSIHFLSVIDVCLVRRLETHGVV